MYQRVYYTFDIYLFKKVHLTDDQYTRVFQERPNSKLK